MRYLVLLPFSVQFAKDRSHFTFAEGLKKDDGSKVQSLEIIIKHEEGKLKISCIDITNIKDITKIKDMI